MHFNKSRDEGFYKEVKEIVSDEHSITIDALAIDEHNRINLTKKVRDTLALLPQDVIVVSKHPKCDWIIFKIQRGDIVVDYWVVKRNLL